MSLPPHPLIIFGTASFGTGTPQAKFSSPTTAAPVLSLLKSHSITAIDTARAYPVGSPGTAEALLGALSAPAAFTISTKVTSWIPGSHSASNIRASIAASLEALGVDSVDVMYLHAPDRATPFEETCKAMDEAWRAGKFRRLGVSNFTAGEVEALWGISERGGWVQPSVYQGRYNALVREGEGELFPLLRRLGMSFYAYSPTAAGLFSGKVTQDSANVAGSRWDSTTSLGRTYTSTYLQPALLAAASRVSRAAEAVGLDGHGVALRWTVYHSALSVEYGDAIVIGASSLEQLEENLAAIEAGPLEEGLLRVVEGVWDAVREEGVGYCV
ncbi:hypothetical protein MMC30_009331 [Trapelia coarctata]|nr:hypothetical protein [Trapelia coarctata]